NAANSSVLEPVVLDSGKIYVSELFQYVHTFGTLDSKLGVVIPDIIGVAAKADDVLFHPSVILFASSRIDHQQIVVFAKLVNDYVVNECALGIEQRRVVCLSNLKLRSIIHADVLNCRKGLRSADQDVSHVTDIKNPHCVADGHMLRDEAGVLDRHVPTAKIDHLRAHLAMDRIQSGLAERGWNLSYGSQ